MPGGCVATTAAPCAAGACWRLRMMKKNTANKTRPMAAMPPTTPPTIAPTGVELPLSSPLPPPPPPPSAPAVVLVVDEESDVEEEDDEVEVVVERLGGVASSVSDPAVIWHCKIENTLPGDAVVEYISV
jgi:hypothetical protein